MHACKYCGFSVPRLEPRFFSFNSPIGYCPECRGLGIKREVDVNLLVPDDNLSLNEGAIEYYKILQNRKILNGKILRNFVVFMTFQ